MAIAKFGEHGGFLASIKELGGLFEKADRKALQTALKSGDFKGVCTALNIHEDRLTHLLRRGAIEASKVAKENPDLAVDALKQHTADGPRR